MEKLDDCLFCKLENTNFCENELAYAIWDKYPLSNGHALIVTKRHAQNFFEANIKEKTAMLELIDEVKKIIDEKFNPDGYNISTNCGKVAGQVVMHLHIHIVPRYKNNANKVDREVKV